MKCRRTWIVMANLALAAASAGGQVREQPLPLTHAELEIYKEQEQKLKADIRIYELVKDWCPSGQSRDRDTGDCRDVWGVEQEDCPTGMMRGQNINLCVPRSDEIALLYEIKDGLEQMNYLLLRLCLSLPECAPQNGAE